MVTVPRCHQQVDVLRDGSDDFTLDPAPTPDQLHVLAAEPRSGGGEQLRRGLSRDFLKLGGGLAPSPGPPQQADRCRLSNLTGVGRGHVQQHDA